MTVAMTRPRHLAWHPSGRWCFVINERAATIDALAYDAAGGGLRLVNTVPTLPAGAGVGAGGAQCISLRSDRATVCT